MLSVVIVWCSNYDKVGLLSGADFENLTMISHDNRTSVWISSFRYVSCIYVDIFAAFFK